MTLIVVGAVVGVLATVALWTARQALQTDAWVDTSTELLGDSEIQAALSTYLADELFRYVDVRGQLQQTLPPDAQGLAVPATAWLRERAERAAAEALQRPVVERLWAEANRVAHQTMMALIRNGSDVLATTGGVVTLDLQPIVERVGAQVGLDVAGRLPEGAGTIEVLRSEQLARVQAIARTLAWLGFVLPILALALFGLAVYLARGWRREALEGVGFALLVVGGLTLVARGVIGALVVDSLGVGPGVEPAARSVWSVGTSLLQTSAWALIGYGILILLASWLAGPTPTAIRTRYRIAPVLRDRRLGYGILALILVLVFWWDPIPATDRLLPALLLIALAVAGLEALRRVSLRDAPRAPMEPPAEAGELPPRRRAG